jgi:hypothetical protein
LVAPPQVELCPHPPHRTFREPSFAYAPAINDVRPGARQLAFHGVCQEDYYFNAVRELRDLMGGLPAQVFSDDADFGAQLATRITNAQLAAPLASAEQVLGQMAQAQGLVISNSSFSWWAAWLAGDRATVVAPAPWFTDSVMPTEDLLPPTWLVRPRSG